MSSGIKRRFSRLREGLITLDQQRIGKAVLAIVLLLDLFILVSIFDGLGDHTRQLVSPEEYIPRQCRDIVLDNRWHADNRLVKTANSIQTYRNGYRKQDDEPHDEQHPTCQNLSSLLRNIKQDAPLSDQLNQFLQLREQHSEVKAELERTRGAYNTQLFEEIAQQPSSESGSALKAQVQAKTQRISRLSQREIEAVAQLQADDSIQQLNAAIDAVTAGEREQLLSDLRSLNFWYPVKKLAMELLFLLPLILVFYLWNSKSLAAGRAYQTLISSHLLVLAFVPVVFKTLELIYDVLPKKFLQQVFALLESFNLVALWHYLMMGVAIAGTLALIYVMQKKVFSAQKIFQKRIAKGQCQQCGDKLGADDNACSGCGFVQFVPCGACDGSTYVHGQYCRTCGVSRG
mgnify:CR=1 FL=1